jgi:hypothetical protein
MFHPAALCSVNPLQVCSLSLSRYHSATPCLTRRTSRVVELTPAMSAGSSVANSGMPCRDSSFSSLMEVKVSRALRSMSSHTTTAKRGLGDAASVSRSAMPPSRGMSASVSTFHDSVRLRFSRSVAPDSTSL